MWQFPQRKMGHMTDMQPTSGTLTLGRAAFRYPSYGYPFRFPARPSATIPSGPGLMVTVPRPFPVHSRPVLYGMHPSAGVGRIFLIVPRDRPSLARGRGPLGPWPSLFGQPTVFEVSKC